MLDFIKRLFIKLGIKKEAIVVQTTVAPQVQEPLGWPYPEVITHTNEVKRSKAAKPKIAK